MKILTLTIFFSVFYLSTQAQNCAIINDKDGFVNVRKDANYQSEIIGKLYNNDIFSYDSESETNSKWVRIYKQRGDINSLDGFVYGNRIYPILNFPSLHKKNTGVNICTLSNDSISVTIRSSRFDPKNHKLSFEGNQTHVDGKLIWGNDDSKPKVRISSVKMIINNKSIDIPFSAFDDLYEPNYRNFDVYLGKNNTIYIEMNNNDGAGAYAIVWIIKGGKYYGRYIDNSEA